MIQMMADQWSQLAGFTFVWTILWQFITQPFRGFFDRYKHKLASLLDPFIHITFDEWSDDRVRRSRAYTAIKLYLGDKSSAQAKRLKADVVYNSQSLVLSMDSGEEVTDEFQGVKLRWSFSQNGSQRDGEQKRSFILTFHKRYRKIVIGSYLDYILEEGKAIEFRKRQRKLYTNNYDRWSYEVFKHPATFQTLAIEQRMKDEIIKDLDAFSKGKEYYARIGKPWKRGYLLYGPPGTGKSTMIAAMANYLDYDVYDLELTAVKSNSDLRRLLVETADKSIIVIEDIDCSLDLTGQRVENETDEEGQENGKSRKQGKRGKNKGSCITLSGLLNMIDGLWSACEGERLIVFTTNYVEKLDPALIRRGRMDKHIEMSYCNFEAFRVLAKNYLKLDSHHMFATICQLLGETNMTPADVAENLMRKSAEEDAGTRLENLIDALEMAKGKADKEAQEMESSATVIDGKERESIWSEYRRAEWGW